MTPHRYYTYRKPTTAWLLLQLFISFLNFYCNNLQACDLRRSQVTKDYIIDLNNKPCGLQWYTHYFERKPKYTENLEIYLN